MSSRYHSNYKIRSVANFFQSSKYTLGIGSRVGHLHHAVTAEVGRRGVDCRNDNVLDAVGSGSGETGGAPAATGGKGRVRGQCDLVSPV